MPRYTLSKAERLSSQKQIDLLFEAGESLSRFPIRLVWRKLDPLEDSPFPVQVMFSVSKKKFPRAVDRNRIKRLMRESYRLQKPDVYTKIPSGEVFALALLFTGNELPEYNVIQKSIAAALTKWIEKINTHLPPSPA